MLAKSPPSSQKTRPISFVLDDQAGGSAPIWVPLVIRPEDLTRSSPSRATLHQTLDPERPGWVDSFGPGLPTINISGHTGWRAAPGKSEDGAAAFETLYRNVFENYHVFRQRAVNVGRDPADVKLLFVDELDGFAWEVVPVSFTLRRSKSRPLLKQYQIALQTVSTLVDVPLAEPDGFASKASLGLSSLDVTLGDIDRYAQDIADFVSSSLGAPAHDFMVLTADVLRVTQKVVRRLSTAVDTVTGSFMAVARDLMLAGRNIFHTLASANGLLQHVKSRLMQVAGAFHNAFCLLSNAFRLKRNFPNFDDLYGASGCSSTNGGRMVSPLLGVNPFYYIVETSNPLIRVNMAAQESLMALRSVDPVLAPVSEADIRMRVIDVISGIGVTGNLA